MRLQVLSDRFPLPKIGGEAPKEILLFRRGKNKTLKGTFYLTDEGIEEILKNYEADGRSLVFDIEHSTYDQTVKPEDRKAVGHFHIELRADGIWAVDIQWVPGWDEKISRGEWVFFSPAIGFNDKREITKIRNVALTNDPATQGIKPMVLSNQEMEPKEPSDTLLAKVRPAQMLYGHMQDCLGAAQLISQGPDAPIRVLAQKLITVLPDYLEEVAEILEQLDPQGETMPKIEENEDLSTKTQPNELLEFCKTLTGKSELEDIKGVLLSLQSSEKVLTQKLTDSQKESVRTLVELGIKAELLSAAEKDVYLSQSMQTIKTALERTSQTQKLFTRLEEKQVPVEILSAKNAPKTAEEIEQEKAYEADAVEAIRRAGIKIGDL